MSTTESVRAVSSIRLIRPGQHRARPHLDEIRNPVIDHGAHALFPSDRQDQLLDQEVG